MARTDLAAPSVIDPAAFAFVAGVYFGSNPNEDFDELLGEWYSEKGQNEDGKAGWYSKRPKVLADFPPLNEAGNFVCKGTCDHCGARFDWGAVYQHKPTGKHIVVGNVCADKTLDVPSRHELEVRRIKSRLAANREAARYAAAARTQADALGFAWLYSTGKHDNKTLNDIAHKGLKFGGLTERQIELVKRLHDGTPAEWEVKKAERQAQRAAEEAAAQPVPSTDARVTVRGTILSTKTQDGYAFGTTVLKMLVKTEAGYKLWGTVPEVLAAEFGGSSEAGDKLRGKTIEFSAKIQRSPEDEKFGFFRRPSKARFIEVQS